MPQNQPNGFYMFMKGEQKKMMALSNRAPTMREMPAICRDSWKRLPPEEKEKYVTLSKQERNKLQASGGTYAKLDSKRQVIADRKDPVKEENKRRNQDRDLLLNSWKGQDARDIIFHVLDFQVMYDNRLERDNFPLEIGMVSFTLRKGIINFMHRFIDPGEVPLGNRNLAREHAEETHKIPLQYEHSDPDLKALTTHMTDFLRSDTDCDDLPPVFCLSIHRARFENCLDFVYSKSFVNEIDRVQKMYCLEDLVHCLINSIAEQSRNVADSQVHDMLLQNRWDYNSSIRCIYHDELDCCFCSLSIVRRYCFALFDILSKLLKFDLTDKHMPEEMEQNFIVADCVGFGRQLSTKAHDRDRDQRKDRFSSKKPAFGREDSSYNYTQNANGWQPPRVNPVRIPTHDDEDSEEEEEEAAPRPKPSEFKYTELRLPKSLAQVQTLVGQMGLHPGAQEANKPSLNAPAAAAASGPVPASAPPPAFGRGALRPALSGAAAPIRPMGRGAAPSLLGQPRLSGMPAGAGVRPPPPGIRPPPPGIRPPPGLQPPPGFAPRPGWSVPAPNPGSNRPGVPQASAGDEHFPALSRSRGFGRARPSLIN